MDSLSAAPPKVNLELDTSKVAEIMRLIRLEMQHVGLCSKKLALHALHEEIADLSYRSITQQREGRQAA